MNHNVDLIAGYPAHLQYGNLIYFKCTTPYYTKGSVVFP